MVCAICYSEITPATGKVELSCSHSFHINCLTTWFVTLNMTQRTQNCPYCRHESSELETIPTNISNQDDIYKEYENIYSDIENIHSVIEGELREEIRILTQSLRMANERADLAEEDAEEAEELARNAHDTLHEYKVAQRARDVAAQKQQIKENWAKWTVGIKK